MTTADARKRTRLTPEQRREQILRAAARLFRDRPYSDVSVAEIADAAGTARGLPNHYFGSKRELYLAVVRRVATVPSLAAVEEGETDERAWTDSVDGFLRLVSQHADAWLASVRVGGAESDSEVAAIIDESKEVVADQTLAALGLAHRAHDPVLRALVRAYGGFVQEITVEWLERGRLDEDQVRTAMTAALPLLVQHVLPRIERTHADG